VRAAQGHGYALEGATAAMDFAVDHLGWTEIIHCIAPENLASIRLAQRLGSSLLRQATMPDPIEKPIDVWGQTAAMWRARR
jgi:RimJ/RimL family protein N-acetyltransferase